MKKSLVVVFGELARSPRMQYHCVSLANNNHDVTVLSTANFKKIPTDNNSSSSGGFEITRDKCCDELESHKNIHQHFIQDDTSSFKNYLPTSLAYALKPIFQAFLLIYHLLYLHIIRKFLADVIIVQNPPSIPTLPILCVYAWLTGAKLIIDWHNYGYSILSLNLKPEHPFVKLSKTIEVFFGRRADAGFCVSKQMQHDLIENFHITYPIHVLYDKPPKHFKPLSLREKHSFYLKMMENQIPEFRPRDFFGNKQTATSTKKSSKLAERKETRFTMSNQGVVNFKPNRPAIIMSSTSWTDDEDFGILFEALKRYDIAKADLILAEPEMINSSPPDLVCVITGKGPLKEYYQKKIEEYKFDHVEFVLPWLASTDYPKMVASCDIGISLHSSSSGVDLPMKVVDMFGCGIPVLALNYDAISELVYEDFFGLTFNNASDLYAKLASLLNQFYKEDNSSPNEVDCSLLGIYKKNIKRHFLLSRWEDNWNREARPVIDRLCASVSTKHSIKSGKDV